MTPDHEFRGRVVLFPHGTHGSGDGNLHKEPFDLHRLADRLLSPCFLSCTLTHGDSNLCGKEYRPVC